MSIDPNRDEDGYEINGRQSDRLMAELEDLLDRVEKHGISIPMVFERVGYRLSSICDSRMTRMAAEDLHKNRVCESEEQAFSLLQNETAESELCNNLVNDFWEGWSTFLAAVKAELGEAVDRIISK